jgi:hypothetical protein
MPDGGKCIVGHAEAHNARHFTSTMTIPGQQPVKIVCCHPCSTAIASRDPRRVVAGKRSGQLKAAIKRTQVEFTKPVPLPKPSSVERSIGRDPSGHG